MVTVEATSWLASLIDPDGDDLAGLDLQERETLAHFHRAGPERRPGRRTCRRRAWGPRASRSRRELPWGGSCAVDARTGRACCRGCRGPSGFSRAAGAVGGTKTVPPLIACEVGGIGDARLGARGRGPAPNRTGSCRLRRLTLEVDRATANPWRRPSLSVASPSLNSPSKMRSAFSAGSRPWRVKLFDQFLGHPGARGVRQVALVGDRVDDDLLAARPSPPWRRRGRCPARALFRVKSGTFSPSARAADHRRPATGSSDRLRRISCAMAHVSCRAAI